MASNQSAEFWMYTDADNTLWDTDAIFADAQLRLLERAEGIAGRHTPASAPLSYLRQYDQAIAKKHHLRLRYPPVLLIRALVMGLQGATSEAAAATLMVSGATPTSEEKSGLEAYEMDLAAIPHLLPGVHDGLQLAYRHGIPVYVVTEGPADTARTRLTSLGILSFTSGVLSASKTRDLYARLAERAAPRRAVMIGDQPDRDVQLARGAGMTAILVASRFRPEWLVANDSGGANAVVPDFLAAVRWVIERSTSHMDGGNRL